MNTNCLESKGNGCKLDYFEKNAYFHGKLMTARDMLAEQKMHEAKLYAVNRFILGEGLVCGLETYNLRLDNGKLMVDIKPGMGIDCCGRLLVVKSTGTVVTKEIKQIEGEEGNGYPEPMHLYVRYKECLKEAVPISGAEDACEEKCCYNHILEVFDVVYSANQPVFPSLPDINFPTKSEYESDNKGALLRIAQDYYDQNLKSDCSDCTQPMIFLGVFNKIAGEDKWKLDVTTRDYLNVAYNNKMLYDIIASHAMNFGNPHEVSAEQTSALVSVDGVSNKGGDVDLVPADAIEITPDNENNSITIGENHSAKTDNPHQITAVQVGVPVSIKNVTNPGGNIDLTSSDNTLSIKTGINTIDLTLSKTLQKKISYLEDQIIALQRYLMDKSLKYKLKVFSEVKARFASKVAENIIEVVKEALDKRVYTDPEEYLTVLKELLDMELKISEELKDQVTEISLKKYDLAVEELGKALKTRNVSMVAVAQDEVCEMAEWLESVMETVAVPEVIKLSLDMAKENIIKAGLDVGNIDEKVSELESGTVIDQKPAGGTVVMIGSAVDLVVAAELKVKVPDVVKMNIEKAKGVLQEAGLTIGIISRELSDLEPDTVLKQNPAAGSEVPVNSRVDLVVASNVAVRVPDVTGMKVDVAKSTIEKTGLTVGTQTPTVSKTKEIGTVSTQSPSAGMDKPDGASVDIRVVTEGVNTPNVVGENVEDAKSYIEKAGLTVGRVESVVSVSEPGTVTYQSPSDKHIIAVGSSVNLNVAAEPTLMETVTMAIREKIVTAAKPVEISTVPNVVDKTVEEAKMTIEKAGLVVDNVTEVVSDLEPGTVIEQFPPHDLNVAAGSMVDLLVTIR